MNLLQEELKKESYFGNTVSDAEAEAISRGLQVIQYCLPPIGWVFNKNKHEINCMHLCSLCFWDVLVSLAQT